MSVRCKTFVRVYGMYADCPANISYLQDTIQDFIWNVRNNAKSLRPYSRTDRSSISSHFSGGRGGFNLQLQASEMGYFPGI